MLIMPIQCLLGSLTVEPHLCHALSESGEGVVAWGVSSLLFISKFVCMSLRHELNHRVFQTFYHYA